MLYLAATPIGNLEDITLRVLDTLRRCDRVLCEDTRHSAILLGHFSIEKPLYSCHQHNEAQRAEELCQWLSAGEEIVYISDAGMPGVNDPGERLVRRCIEAGLPFTVLPGASAAPTVYWPVAPILKSPVLKAKPTERPVMMSGAA